MPGREKPHPAWNHALSEGPESVEASGPDRTPGFLQLRPMMIDENKILRNKLPFQEWS